MSYSTPLPRGAHPGDRLPVTIRPPATWPFDYAQHRLMVSIDINAIRFG